MGLMATAGSQQDRLPRHGSKRTRTRSPWWQADSLIRGPLLSSWEGRSRGERPGAGGLHVERWRARKSVPTDNLAMISCPRLQRTLQWSWSWFCRETGHLPFSPGGTHVPPAGRFSSNHAVHEGSSNAFQPQGHTSTRGPPPPPPQQQRGISHSATGLHSWQLPDLNSENPCLLGRGTLARTM